MSWAMKTPPSANAITVVPGDGSAGGSSLWTITHAPETSLSLSAWADVASAVPPMAVAPATPAPRRSIRLSTTLSAIAPSL